MDIKIFISNDNSHIKRIKSAIALINGCQKYFHLKCVFDNKLAKSNTKINAKNLCVQFETTYPKSYCILISEDLLNDNWFSHEYRSSSLITIGDWEIEFAPPSLKSYLMYQIALSLIHFSADLTEEMALNHVHEPPQGCLLDMCVNKLDIKLGMITGNLCQICEGKLRTLGINQQTIDGVINILELVRSEALGRPIELNPEQIFVVMRFTNNNENDNSWKYGIKTGIEESGFTPIRADTLVESQQIFDKIYNYIRKSRLIVAKVDEQNLNVYFELGLAMGLGKDVLLISENSLVIQLPSDLKNWECLTYEKGNYEQLKNKIKNFYLQIIK
jgi:hypothetical protein